MREVTMMRTSSPPRGDEGLLPPHLQPSLLILGPHDFRMASSGMRVDEGPIPPILTTPSSPLMQAKSSREVSQLRIQAKAAYLKERCREVVQLRILPKAAYLDERCREVVQLRILPKAACLEVRCREVVQLRILPTGAYLEVSGGRPFKDSAEGCIP